MWWVAFIERATYTDVFGRKMEAYRVGGERVGVFVMPPSKDFGDFMFQSYPPHMFAYYWLVKMLRLEDERALIFPLVFSIFWELFEEKALRTTPVSVGDIFFGVLGGFFAKALPKNLHIFYEFTPLKEAKVGYPFTGIPSLDTTLYSLNTNYTPFKAGLVYSFNDIILSLGFSYSYGKVYPYKWPYKTDGITSVRIGSDRILSLNIFDQAPLVPNSPTFNLSLARRF